MICDVQRSEGWGRTEVAMRKRKKKRGEQKCGVPLR